MILAKFQHCSEPPFAHLPNGKSNILFRHCWAMKAPEERQLLVDYCPTLPFPEFRVPAS